MESGRLGGGGTMPMLSEDERAEQTEKGTVSFGCLSTTRIYMWLLHEEMSKLSRHRSVR
jgi:hypothetical protein